MKLDMDKIQFEHRWEIDEIAEALKEYQEDQGKNETVTKLINLLDAMWMNW